MRLLLLDPCLLLMTVLLFIVRHLNIFTARGSGAACEDDPGRPIVHDAGECLAFFEDAYVASVDADDVSQVLEGRQLVGVLGEERH